MFIELHLCLHVPVIFLTCNMSKCQGRERHRQEQTIGWGACLYALQARLHYILRATALAGTEACSAERAQTTCCS